MEQQQEKDEEKEGQGKEDNFICTYIQRRRNIT